MKAYTVFFFANGVTACCKDGQQVPELQRSWAREYIKVLEDNNVDITDVEFNMPDGRKLEIVKNEEGWNWKQIRRLMWP